MTTTIGQWLQSLALAQSGDAPHSGSGLTYAFGLGFAAACVVLVWAILQLRSAKTRLSALTVEHRSTTEAHRALLDKERKQAKALDGKRDNVKDLKHDLGAAKKKNHKLQEELKEVRAQLKDAASAAEKARTTRPAFAEPAAAKPKVEAISAPPKKQPEVAVAKAPTADVASDDAARLQKQIDELKASLQEEREKMRNQRSELSRLKRRAEDQRRIDAVVKGQQSILEDKIRTLGRQYYDAVSELAALKGEVKPPPPRDLASAKPFDNGEEPIDSDEPVEADAPTSADEAKVKTAKEPVDNDVAETAESESSEDATEVEAASEAPVPEPPPAERDVAPEANG